MPSFFIFDQGRERFQNESSPLLGRFRAVPNAHTNTNGRARRKSLLGFSIDGFGGAFGGRDEGDEGGVDGYYCDGDEEDEGGAVAWCALPFPQYELPDGDNIVDAPSTIFRHKIPGHGEARVEINFWFFLFVYYGFYNITALMWITKVFNIYSLNWWPKSLGFPITVSIIAAMSIAAPIPFYCIPELRYITSHNTAWICWTFFAMAMPLLVAFAILLNHERHLGLRIPLSETQRLFTSSWWTGETDTINARDRPRRANIIRSQSTFDPNASLEVALASDNIHRSRDASPTSP
ncbi:hypothetical protein BOTCAL_0044g00200 [Botryotinia calthae]|uniref:Uncharacterized protein n=1 Tax=Botryotinia calthae TaxID=38488 RepID=A0A4Y8DEB7_9HELO|nr:hypothetical protein BOTCAL_0044g00200 [Botryotinia calthae]